ncbi:MAG: DUF4118 domain-containing protein, partial [Acidimicrobiales bacterium]
SASALTMVVVISAVAIPGTRLSGVLASVSSGLWFDLFLTPPYGHISIARRPDIETTISILIVGVIITELALRSRIHRRASNETVGFLIKIHEVTELASSSAPVAVVIDETRKSLIEILGLRSCRFERGRSDPPLARIESNGQVMHVGMRWPVDDVGIPGPEAEIVARWRGRSLGRFVLVPSPGRPVSLERRVVAVSLVDVAAAYVAAEDRGR